MRRLLPALLALLLTPATAREFTVVAYNVENLFDLDGQAGYEDYQSSRYRPAHALTKLRTIARVLARYEAGRGPDVVLLSELEVDRTPGTTPPDYAALLAPFSASRSPTSSARASAPPSPTFPPRRSSSSPSRTPA